MKRCILVDSRTNKDEKTKDELLFMTLYCLATKSKKGGLWHPKKNDAEINVCFNKTKAPHDYEAYIKCVPGALFDITFGVNDFTNKTFVATCTLVPGSNIYTEEQVYL